MNELEAIAAKLTRTYGARRKPPVQVTLAELQHQVSNAARQAKFAHKSSMRALASRGRYRNFRAAVKRLQASAADVADQREYPMSLLIRHRLDTSEMDASFDGWHDPIDRQQPSRKQREHDLATLVARAADLQEKATAFLQRYRSSYDKGVNWAAQDKLVECLAFWWLATFGVPMPSGKSGPFARLAAIAWEIAGIPTDKDVQDHLASIIAKHAQQQRRLHSLLRGTPHT